MASIMLMTENAREGQILKMALEQSNLKVVQSNPTYSNYVKALQFIPDFVLMEIPRVNMNQIHFSSIMRKHKKTRKIPIIGYGDRVDRAMGQGMSKGGVSRYLERPLKFSALLEIIQEHLKQLNKSLATEEEEEKTTKEGDIVAILDHETLPTKKIELMTKHVSGLMAFPFTVAKVLRLVDNSKTGAADLSKVMEADPVISANILKVSNTVFFASLNRRISTIKDAVVRIGLRETKRIVMGMSVMAILDKKNNNLGFDRMAFWQHSLATALIAERIAKRMGRVNTDEAFLAGLLHDFGIILLDEFFPTVLAKVLDATTNNASRFVDNEVSILGISHNDVVKELFAAWKLPEAVAEGVCLHYSVCENAKEPKTPGEKLGLCTALGNYIAKALCLGRACDQYVMPMGAWAFAGTRLNTGLGERFLQDVAHDLETYQKFLDITPEKGDVGQAEPKKIGLVNLDKAPFEPLESYFPAQGHKVIPIRLSGSYSQHDCALDAVFVWTGEDTTREFLAPLAGIVARSDEAPAPDRKPKLTPVLAMVHQGSRLAGDPGPDSVSFMYNCFDLRVLDVNLNRILKGDRITLDESTPRAAMATGHAAPDPVPTVAPSADT